MLKESEEALSLFPNMRVLSLQRYCQITKDKQYEEAVKILLSGSKLVIDMTVCFRDFYSQLVIVIMSWKQRRIDKYMKGISYWFEEFFYIKQLQLLLISPREKLDKAEAMSKLSNELTLTRLRFQDSMHGSFTRGKIQWFKRWLEKAMTTGEINTEPSLTLRDVLFNWANRKSYWVLEQSQAAGEASDLIW